MAARKCAQNEELTSSAEINNLEPKDELESIVVRIEGVVPIKPKNRTFVNFSTKDDKIGSVCIDKVVDIGAFSNDVVKILNLTVGTRQNMKERNKLKHYLYPQGDFEIQLIRRNGIRADNLPLVSFFAEPKQDFDARTIVSASARSGTTLLKNFEVQKIMDDVKVCNYFMSKIEDEKGQITHIFVDEKVKLVELLQQGHWITVGGEEKMYENGKARFVKHQSQMFYQGKNAGVLDDEKPGKKVEKPVPPPRPLLPHPPARIPMLPPPVEHPYAKYFDPYPFPPRMPPGRRTGR
uniref:Transmembrane protein n=1 Tax=Panagrolaimus sp. JU765 TaxID=591449 RepID=A0AC34QR40_9BILA